MTYGPFSTPYNPDNPCEILHWMFFGGRANLRDPDTLKRAHDAVKIAGTENIDGQGQTPLLGACRNQRADYVAFLLHNGANVHHQDLDQLTALHYAALPRASHHRNPQQEGGLCVRMLLGAGADINMTERLGRTPLVWALDYVDCHTTDDNDLNGLIALVDRGALDGIVSPKDLDEISAGLGEYNSISDVILDPQHGYPAELVQCVRSWVSKASLVEQIDPTAGRPTKRDFKL